MVFFVSKIRFVQSGFFLGIAILTGGLCGEAAGGITAGPHYPDVEVQVVSDERLVVRYTPWLSDDLETIGRVSPYLHQDRHVLGRVILVAVPPEGEISYTVTFNRAGWCVASERDRYISAETPLVVREPAFLSRGHRFVRLVVFPQRMENGRLAVYTDFIIDISFSGVAAPTTRPARLSRLDSVLAGTVVNPGQFYRFGAGASTRPLYKQIVDPFAGSDRWARIAVTESGVTRIGGSQLSQAGFDLSGVRSDSIRLFYAGGVNPSDTPSAADPEFYQVAIRMQDGGDGNFGMGDYILFYAEAPSRFEYETGLPVYMKNPYHDGNYYWLSIGGHTGVVALRWGIVDGTPSGGAVDTATATRQAIRVEQDNVIKVDSDGRIRDYFDWYWSNNADEIVSVNLPDCVPGDSIEIILAGVSSFSGSTMRLNGVSLPGEYISNDLYRFWDITGAAVPGLNTFEIHFTPVIGDAYLDYLNVDYPRYLRYSGRQLELNSAGHAGFTIYTVSAYTASHQVLDITDPDMPVVVSGVEITGDTARFERPELAQSLSRYLIYAAGDIITPAAVEAADPGLLRRDVSQYDCIVVAPQRFREALGEYVQYRQETNGYRIKLAAVEDIYNAFGFGLESPMAIRNYLGYTYGHCDPPAPFAVLLVGDGNYDFLDNLGLHAPSYIPPFIWGQEFSAGDDNYVYFGQFGWLDSDSSYIYQSDRGWDMMIARWPMRSASDVSEHIEAIKQYESPDGMGSWRHRITYVADDEFKGGLANEIIHTAQAETLAVLHTPAELVKKKIYLTDYPFASNGEKPAVTDDIIKAVNEGTLMLNYIGHGSPDVWADEHVLRKSRDLSRMQNVERPTVVVAGSCSIGFFDDPGREGMAELMFRQPGAAIETVSATRLVYATDNAIFNYDLYDGIFGQRLNVSEATYAAKVMHQYGFNYSLIRNDRSYVVFGDPLGRFGIPEYRLQFESADSVLTPLQQFVFTGSVTDQAGNPAAVDGPVDITVYDSRIIKHHPLGLDYSLGGPVIFRGTVEAQGGEFSGGFIVPLDVDYGGSEAQIAGYGDFGVVSAIGGIDSLAIAQTAASTEDNSGPEIQYRFEDVPDFASGDRVPANATVIVNLNDISGINLTGGLGHRIELVIDNDNNATINLTDQFKYLPGSYQEGELSAALPDLTPELHSFRITAWDNANNPASVEFEALPSMESRIAIHNVMNWPNPMEDRTEFFFELTESADWVELQIFTLSGRMIKSFRSGDVPLGRNRRFLWDGRDLDGDRVAQGVYLYKITAKGRSGFGTQSSDTMTETFGKLIVLN